MIVYVYAIADGIADITDVAVNRGEGLRVLTLEDMSVVVEERAAVPATDRESLETQDCVVRALHEHAAALLPARFGTAYRTADDLAVAIATRRDRLHTQLDEVRGREQMTLRVLGATSANGRSAPEDKARSEADIAGRRGTAYLSARAARGTPAVIAPLLDTLAPLVHGTRVEPGRSAGLIATVYHLIDRGASEEYRRVAESAALGLGELSVRISGPSPCYAFT